LKVVARDKESGERATASLDIEVLQRGQSGTFHDIASKRRGVMELNT